MKWGWRKIDEQTWRFDDDWQVVKDWGTNGWFVVRSGKWLLEEHKTAGDAIAAAERLMEGK